MSKTEHHERILIITGLGVALVIAVLLSPFASSNPDGLDRVAQDYQFEDKALADAPATKLPFYGLFEEYSLRNVPPGVSTSLAGLAGTLATFGLAWGIGKLAIRDQDPTPPEPSLSSDDDQP